MTKSFIEAIEIYKQFKLQREQRTTFAFIKHFLTGQHEKVWALKNINFRADAGQKIGLIGNNGSGKTTLLKILAGLYQPTLGKVNHKGDIHLFTTLGLGLSDEYTVYENIYLYGAICGLTSRYIDNKFNEIIEFAELRDYINSKIKTLSTGMVQRLAFSVATHVRSDILLLDEALSAGDKDFKAKSDKVMESYKNSSMIIIVSTHDLKFVSNFCDKVIWLDKGEQMACGNPHEVINKYLQHKVNV